MASVTGDSDLRRLEREAENARARLHETIAEIRDPRTIDHAKLEMKHRANDMKERALDYMRERRDEALDGGRSQVSDFSRRLQMTAIQNPLPILMIGAGIGWHLWKRPPVTSVLVGTGLWQLMKNWDQTPDATAYRDPYNRARPRGYVPGGIAGENEEDVRDIPSAMTRAKVEATDLSYRAEDAVSGVADTMTQAKEAVTSRVQDMAGRVQASMQPMMERVAPLFNEDNRGRLGMMALVAGVGMVAGHMLRNSESARHMMEDARLAADRGLDRMRDATQNLNQRSAQEMAAEHPLLLSLMGFALGAVLGGMIRQMPEMENMSERATQAMESLRETVTGEMPQHKQAQMQRDRVSA